MNFDMKFKDKDIQVGINIYNSKAEKQILCLHGLGWHGETFEKISKYLREKLICPDWIGFGNSSKFLEAQDTYSADYCSEWLLFFIRQAIDKKILKTKFSIVALSMSAIAIAKIYDDIDDHVEKIVLINPAGLDYKINLGLALGTNLFLGRVSSWLLLANPLIGDNIKKRIRKDLSNGLTETKILRRYCKQGIKLYGRMKSSHIMPKDFNRIRKSLLLLYSSHDNVFFEKNYLKYASDRDNWNPFCIDHVNHNILTQKPKEVAKAIEEFLRK